MEGDNTLKVRKVAGKGIRRWSRCKWKKRLTPNEVKSEKNPDLQRRAIAATKGNSGDAFNRAPLWTVDRLQKSPAKINPKSFAEIQSISGDANWALAATEY